MIAQLRRLYSALPAPAQRLARLIPFSLRMGGVYRQTLRFLLTTDSWSAKRYRAYQAERLGVTLENAIRFVPHYGKYRAMLGGDPFAMLRDIEPISKADIQNDPEAFLLPKQMRRGTHVNHTGGSSGAPLRMVFDNDSADIEWAFIIALWMRVGYRPGAPRATFRGVEFSESKSVHIRENPVYNEVFFSPFHLTDAVLAEYVRHLRTNRPSFLRGYPSALITLARYIEDAKVSDLPPFAALLCGSEGFSPTQREYLERIFQTRVYSWYGQTEKVVLAGECEMSMAYHAFPQYGITEICDTSGNITTAVGAAGEIVGTGFLNRVMPFIRYRMEDYSQILAHSCSDCGRAHTLLGPVEGHRVQDYIIGKSGAQISMTALNRHDDTFSGIRNFQFQQRTPGKVIVKILPRSGFDRERRTLIIRTLEKMAGGEIDFAVEIVETIDTTAMGKGVYLRQEIPGLIKD